jgi:hypothetical protein
MVPIARNGEVLYIDRGLRGLGVSEAFITTTTNITNVTSAAAAAVPNKPVSYQSDFSKTANVVATGAATVAAVAAVVPVIGTVVAAVAGIVAVAAVLLGKIFKNSKAKKYAAERGQYEMVNAQIRYENEQLDNQYIQTAAAIDELKSKIASLGLNGFGDCGRSGGLGSKASRERDRLQSAKDENALLIKEQESKTTAMASLLDEYNKMIKGLLELNQSKSTNEWLLWILGGSAVVIGSYFAYKNRKQLTSK